MLTEQQFLDILRDLFSDLLPKVKGDSRKEFTVALLDELKSNGVDFEEEPSSLESFDSQFSDD